MNAPVPANTCTLPRLIRYVPEGALPGDDLLAVFDPKTNLLVVNKDAFDQLDKAAQKLVLRTQRTLTKR